MSTDNKILSLGGEPIGDTSAAVATEDMKQPTKHDPRWFRRVVEAADKRFAQLYEQAIGDLNTPKTPGTGVDTDQVIREYQHLWAQYCHHLLNSAEPVKLNVQAMKVELQKTVAAAEKMKRRNTPLNELGDLTEFHYKLVGRSLNGDVWLNSHAVLVVGDGGEVWVYLTESTTPCGTIPIDLLQRTRYAQPHLKRVGLTMQHVYNLLAAYLVEETAMPTEEQVAEARTNTSAH